MSTTSKPHNSIPEGAWDSHMHICEPDLFPLSAKASYQPHPATLSEAHAIIGDKLGIHKWVFAQPSTYGNDNSCLINALEKTGSSNGRGVVVFDPKNIKLDRLKEWHERGVRGVRVNLKSVGAVLEPEQFRTTLLEYANAIRPLKTWVLQLYMDLDMMDLLEPLMKELDVKVVVDHFGGPPTGGLKPAGRLGEMKGWDSLKKFMKSPKAYVKISAPYRFTHDTEFRDLEPLARELFGARGGKGCVFASDWPHTRFESVDVSPWVDRCVEWCGKDGRLLEDLFRCNAEELWDVPPVSVH